MCAGVLCVSTHCFSFDNCNIESDVVRKAVVRLDLCRFSLYLGNEGVICICRAVCEEREETAGSVSCIFLLLDSWMADSTILKEI